MRTEECSDWLRRACKERSRWVLFLNVDPAFGSLRGEPCFGRLLGEIGFADAAIPMSGRPTEGRTRGKPQSVVA